MLQSSSKAVENLLELRLKASALSAKQGKALGLKPLVATAIRALGSEFEERSGVVIPYLDEHGKDTKFYRVRYLEEPSGFAALAAKVRRYAQPSKTLCGAYLPHGVGADWASIVSDAERPLLITEGELKAASATAHGLATIGLGGVFNFKSTARGLGLIPMLERITWKGRQVTIAFDSDAATNPMVVLAIKQLGDTLMQLGAWVTIASLPPLSTGAKAGLDDIIAHEGAEHLTRLLAEADEHPVASALWQLNTEVVYVKNPPLIAEINTDRRMSWTTFTRSDYVNRRIMVPKELANGDTRLEDKSLAEMWLAWSARFEVNRLAYQPGEERITKQRNLNAWRGWGVQPAKGDVKPWHELLDYTFDKKHPDSAEARAWFERWCAYPLRYPGTKLYSAVVVWGRVQGTGKTLIGYTLARIYGENATEIGQEHLHGSFNDWSANKQFIIADEITGTDKRRDADRLKSYITQQRLRVNTKYLPAYEIDDCVNYYFTSQHPDAFYLEDTDRRFFVWEFPSAPKPKPFYEAYDRWYKSDAGAGALFDYLLRLDLGDFNPRSPPPLTSAKAEMISDTRSDLARFCAQLIEAPEVVLERFAPKAELATSAQLMAIYDPTNQHRVTANGLTLAIKRAGGCAAVQGRVVRTNLGPQRLLAFKNMAKWYAAEPGTATKHFNAAWGASPLPGGYPDKRW